MFFHLQEWLRDDFGPLNVFRYVSFRVLAASTTAVLITLLLYPWFIRRLQAKQIGQSIRSDGPSAHLTKAGTPTMGGALMLFAVLSSSLLWCDLSNPVLWLTLGVTVGFGIIGFIDDFRKVRDRNSRGLPGLAKLGLQFLIGGLAVGAFFLFVREDVGYDLKLSVPFLRWDLYGIELHPLVYGMFASILIAGYSNAVNLTDGLDGLAIVPVIVAASTFLVLAYLTDAHIGNFDLTTKLLIPRVRGVNEMAVFCAAIAGAGVGFLWYNTYPAQVFMGDVGSLSLGGALGCMAFFTKNELLSVIILGLFVLEAVSVITQTVSFKLTGRRVFRMAPIHHHYELKGWAEPKIIVRFWIISMLLSLFALATIKLR